jgi:hypothetical protein
MVARTRIAVPPAPSTACSAPAVAAVCRTTHWRQRQRPVNHSDDRRPLTEHERSLVLDAVTRRRERGGRRTLSVVDGIDPLARTLETEAVDDFRKE